MRTFDAVLFNEVANEPSIRPLFGGNVEEPIDLTTFARNIDNYCFANEDGGFLCNPMLLNGTVIECHTVFKPGSDPRKTVRFMRECIEYLFTRCNITKIVTRVPDDNVPADKLSKLAWFEEDFRRENVWKQGVGVSYRSLPLDRWVAVCSTTLEAGKAFHRLLEDAKKAKGSTLPVHEDEEIHDRWVGAAMLMALQGNVAKAVNTYNLWAIQSGYAPVRMLSEQPPIVDVVDAVIGVDNGKLQVLHCQ